MLNQLHKPDPSLKYYIKTIPKNFHEYPHYFMQAELPKLNNTFMYNRLQSQNSSVNNLFKVVQRAKNLSKNFTLDEVKHAYIAIMSRNFGVKIKSTNKDYNALAPVIDMFNYDPLQANTNWTGELPDENKFFTLKAAKNIPKGKEIFVYYGDHDDQHFLFNYGFTMKKNPFQPENDNFVYSYKGKNYESKLSTVDSKNLINIVQFHRVTNNLPLIVKKTNKEKVKKMDLEVFTRVLESLKKYSDKARIREYKKNQKKNPNYTNIYKSLLTEDALIDKNVKFLEEIIEILKGGKQKLKKKASSKVVIQNHLYFADVLQ